MADDRGKEIRALLSRMGQLIVASVQFVNLELEKGNDCDDEMAQVMELWDSMKIIVETESSVMGMSPYTWLGENPDAVWVCQFLGSLDEGMEKGLFTTQDVREAIEGTGGENVVRALGPMGPEAWR